MLLSCGIVKRLALVHLTVHHPGVHLLHAEVLLKVLQSLGQLLVAHADGHGPVAVSVGALVVHLHLLSSLLLLLNIPGTINAISINMISNKLKFNKSVPQKDQESFNQNI